MDWDWTGSNQLLSLLIFLFEQLALANWQLVSLLVRPNNSSSPTRSRLSHKSHEASPVYVVISLFATRTLSFLPSHRAPQLRLCSNWLITRWQCLWSLLVFECWVWLLFSFRKKNFSFFVFPWFVGLWNVTLYQNLWL
jgi:hypothetical protein